MAGLLVVIVAAWVMLPSLAYPTTLSTAARTGARAGAEPVVDDVRAPSRVTTYERFEVTGDITPVPANPFDPDQIDVQAVFRAPDGSEHRALGFWYQGFERRLVDGKERLRRQGDAVWKSRFAPPLPGRWEWRWEVRTPAGTTATTWRTLRVSRGGDPGYVRRSDRDPSYLALDDGSPYFAIGENTAWYDDRGTFAYDDWFAALARQDATYGRLWMPSWAFGIEWKDTGLGDYRERLDRAWQLDRVVQRAERSGLYLVVSLLNHGAFSTVFNSEWADNPYNAANGGPLASPGEFFTDDQARALFERRLRYIVARWGYSTHVLAWELWNEADLTDGYDSAASVAWHREMADELRRLDAADHLVTTSFAVAGNDPAVWAGAGLDYTQVHAYARAEVARNVIELFANVARHVSELTATRRAETNVPVLFAELGVDARGPGETEEADPEGIGIHDGLWAGALSGGAGTAMTWWWDNLVDVQPRRYYPMFGVDRPLPRRRRVGSRPARGGERDGVVRVAPCHGVRTSGPRTRPRVGEGRRLPVERTGARPDRRRCGHDRRAHRRLVVRVVVGHVEGTATRRGARGRRRASDAPGAGLHRRHRRPPATVPLAPMRS